jgi:hypothetical protein
MQIKRKMKISDVGDFHFLMIPYNLFAACFLARNHIPPGSAALSREHN